MKNMVPVYSDIELLIWDDDDNYLKFYIPFNIVSVILRQDLWNEAMYRHELNSASSRFEPRTWCSEVGSANHLGIWMLDIR